MRVVFLGLPGSGKGTQAALIATAAGVPHIATGDLFRQHVRDRTELGQTVRGYMDRGENVPDQLTIAMVRGRLQEPDAARGFVLDGFPRTLPQAEALDTLLQDLGAPLDCALYLEVDGELVIRRMTGRRVCPKCGAVYHVEAKPPKTAGVCDACGTALVQRSDDREDVVRHRIEVQWAEAEPLVPYYAAQHKLREVRGDGPVDEVAATVASALGLPSA